MATETLDVMPLTALSPRGPFALRTWREASRGPRDYPSQRPQHVSSWHLGLQGGVRRDLPGALCGREGQRSCLLFPSA